MEWYSYRTWRDVDGETVPGVFLPGIIHNGQHYFTLLAVYKDSVIDCWGHCTLDEFVRKVESGWVVNSVPPEHTLSVHAFATFKINECTPHGSTDDLVRNVRSAIEQLNGRPTAQEEVILAMKAYREDESLEHFEQLKAAFAKLPSFDRKFTFGSRFERYIEIQRKLGIERPKPS
jgi:hypothetical protein